jgi:hypothetical protein
MINSELKCIFIHINRCGGKSIEKALWNIEPSHGSSDHRTIKGLQRIMKKKIINSYFKFTICRNPWDRIVSLYNYYKRVVYDDVIENKYITEESLLSFRNFCYHVRDNQTKLCPTQLSYILGIDGKPKMDFIGRLENIGDDWKNICEKLEINIKLPHLNKSKRWWNIKKYKKYYDRDLTNVIKTIYKDDIDFFNYKGKGVFE